jgi:hypothetical protein
MLPVTLPIALALLLSTSNGCMVMDEVDSAAAKMPARKGKAREEVATESNAAVEPVAQRTSALLEQSKQWWDRATSLAPGEMESSIVRCRLREGTHFMSRDDCLSQGGQPSDSSG